MTFGTIILIALALFMMAGALPLVKQDVESAWIFQSPVFIALILCLAGSLLYCCWRRISFQLRGLCFLAVHFSVVLILLGASIGFFMEKKFNLYATVGTGKAAQRVADNGGLTAADLGFDVLIPEFNVDYFPPDAYSLYRMDVEKPDASLELLGTFKADGDSLRLGDFGTVPLSELKDPDGPGGWKIRHRIAENMALILAKPAVRHYQADVNFADKEHGVEKGVEISVNHPGDFKGWRFYLMDYGENDRTGYAVLLARSDPGRKLVIAGIWMLAISTTLQCWLAAGKNPRRDPDCLPEEKNQ